MDYSSFAWETSIGEVEFVSDPANSSFQSKNLMCNSFGNENVLLDPSNLSYIRLRYKMCLKLCSYFLNFQYYWFLDMLITCRASYTLKLQRQGFVNPIRPFPAAEQAWVVKIISLNPGFLRKPVK